MSKEIINKDGTLFKQRTTPDWQEGYEQGLLAGYTKSIVLTRHLQRTLSANESISSTTTLFEILGQAMELIAENIEEESEEEKSINQMKRSR